VEFFGEIDENADFAELRRRLKGPVVFHLAEVRRINSCGVREWVNPSAICRRPATFHACWLSIQPNSTQSRQRSLVHAPTCACSHGGGWWGRDGGEIEHRPRFRPRCGADAFDDLPERTCRSGRGEAVDEARAGQSPRGRGRRGLIDGTAMLHYNRAYERDRRPAASRRVCRRALRRVRARGPACVSCGAHRTGRRRVDEVAAAG
jgi:hypothetical protein